MNFSLYKTVDIADRPKNIYRVHVTSWHGDADMFSTQERDISDHNLTELERVVKLMLAYFELDHNTACDENAATQAIEIRGSELGIKYPTDIFSELAARDVTNDGRLATPERMRVTWFNEYGTEYYVRIELDNGKTLTEINRGFDKP